MRMSNHFVPKTIGSILLIMMMFFTLLTGCGSSSSLKAMSSSSDSSTMNGAGDMEYDYDTAGPMETASEDYASTTSEDMKQVDTESVKADQKSEYSQKLIYTYYFDFDTTEYDKSMEQINKSVQKYNGYMESCSEYGTENHSSSMVIRIPAEHADAWLAETGSIGTVTFKEVSSEDITLRYFDTKAHLETLETQRKRLLELLEKAKSISDITKIQSQLTDVEYEINSYTMQLKVYDNQVDYVTIHINLNEVTTINPTESDGFITRVKKGLSSNTVDLVDGIVAFVIWFITMIPYFIVLGLLGVLIGCVVKKIRNHKKANKKEQ